MSPAELDRRSTGTHYTPRSLTEPMVKTHARPTALTRVWTKGEEPDLERLKTPARDPR